jgi:hypothetical protein
MMGGCDFWSENDFNIDHLQLKTHKVSFCLLVTDIISSSLIKGTFPNTESI